MGQVHFSQGMCDHFLFEFVSDTLWMISTLPPSLFLHQSFRFTEPLLLPFQMFLVCRDSNLKRLVLCVHFPSLKDSSTEVLEYPIKEEKSSKFSPHLPPSYTVEPASHKSSTLSPCLKLEWGKSFSELA